MKPGDRVGAILSATEEVVKLLGYGVYAGDEIPMQGVMSPLIHVEAWRLGRKNPRINLDKGEVVYGCECWWGPEERIRQAIGDRKVEDISIVAIRSHMWEDPAAVAMFKKLEKKRSKEAR